jgi:iron complex transport system ATP-binding protein
LSVLAARALRVAYGEREVLHGIDLRLQSGEIVALLGPNGAGKTTLLRALSGLLTPSSGTVELAGRALESLTRAEIARAIAVVPQDVPSAPGFTVRDVVAMGRAPHQTAWLRERSEDAEVIARVLARCGLAEFADRTFSALSGGERKRVLVAQALAQSPSVLLLDEPSAFLDLRHAVTLFELAREEASAGVAVAAIVHDLGLAARYADRAVLLVDGAIAAEGPPREVLDEAQITAAFGVPIRRLSDEAGLTMAFAPAARPR